MKLKKIAVLTALALSGVVAGQAHAAMSNAQKDLVNDANTNGRVIYISGASAVQKGFTGIIGKLFDTSSVALTYFSNTNADVSGTDYVAVAGVLAPEAGTWAGQNAIVVYRTKGGSVWGVDPVARNTLIESLNVVDTCGTLGAGTSASPFTCGFVDRAPDAGVSDVAPALFKGAGINTEGETPAAPLSEDELAELTANPIYALAFGLPVTTNVPATTNFNRATVAAIMAGNFKGWNKVDSSLTGDIVICRRVPGSGTQAVSNLWAANFPCGASNSITARASTTGYSNDVDGPDNIAGNTDDNMPVYTINASTTSTGSAAKLWVVENSTSGDVKKCLDAANGGASSYTTKDRSGRDGVKVTFNGPAKAIGVLSMDSLSGSTTTSKWTFRTINGAGQITQASGAQPVVTGSGISSVINYDTTSNLPKGDYVEGDWDNQGWVSFNVPNRTVNEAPEKTEVLTQFLTLAQDPAVLNSISSLKYVAAGIPGNGYAAGANQAVLQAGYSNGDQCAPYVKK